MKKQPTNHPQPSRTTSEFAAEFAALAGLDALDGTDAESLEHCRECPLGRALLQRENFEEIAAAMHAATFPPVAPPADLKDKLMAKIDADTETKPQGGYFFLGEDEGEWDSIPGGVRLKILSDLSENGHTLVLLEAAPGATFLPHAHKGTEEVFLISGDLETNGRVMGPGDYLRSSPGTRHHRATSRNGCRALMITARENHPRKAIGLYNGLLRSLGALRGKADN